MALARIINATGSSQNKSVCVVTTAPASASTGLGEIGTATQATGPSGNTYPTYHLAPTGTVGVKTLYIPGFSAVG